MPDGRKLRPDSKWKLHPDSRISSLKKCSMRWRWRWRWRLEMIGGALPKPPGLRMEKNSFCPHNVLRVIPGYGNCCCCSVAKLFLTLCDPLGLQHARLLCPPGSPRACSNSCPLSRWCYPTISSSANPFSFCLQTFPAPGPFPTTQFFASGSQSIGASASATILPMNIQDWFLLKLTGLVILLSKGLSRVFSNTIIWKHHSLALILLCDTTHTSVHDYWKNHGFNDMNLCWQSDVPAF